MQLSPADLRLAQSFVGPEYLAVTPAAPKQAATLPAPKARRFPYPRIPADLTAEALRTVLHYDPVAGQFTRLVRTANKHQVGEPVGLGTITKGYHFARLGPNVYALHRLAWLYVHGAWPTHEIDHINGDRADNRIANLRVVSRAQNSQNQRAAHSRNLSSGLLGVGRHKNRWAARILFNGCRKRLGMYDTPEQAHAAYLEAKRRLHAGCTI